MTALSNREQFGELMVMPGDWGLPSIDLRCLTVMAYVRFTGAPIQFSHCEGPKSLVENDAPVYIAPGDERVKGSAQCIIQVTNRNCQHLGGLWTALGGLGRLVGRRRNTN